MGHLAVNLVSCSSAAGQEVTTLQSQDVNLKSSVYMCSDSWASLLARPPRISKSSAHFLSDFLTLFSVSDVLHFGPIYLAVSKTFFFLAALAIKEGITIHTLP